MTHSAMIAVMASTHCIVFADLGNCSNYKPPDTGPASGIQLKTKEQMLQIMWRTSHEAASKPVSNRVHPVKPFLV